MRHKLWRGTSIVASMTLLSRIMGFVRDATMAILFGAGPAFDAFVIAFKIPNLMRRLFGEGAFSQAFVPVLAEYRTRESHAQVQQFVNHVAGALACAVALCVGVMMLCAPQVVLLFAPGFAHDTARLQLATHMMTVMSPYLWFIALSAFLGAVLNTYKKFAIPALMPVVLNIVLVSIAWLWARYADIPIYIMAWGVLLGGFIQLGLQVPALKSLQLVPRLAWGFTDPGVRRVLKLMVPALFGVSVAQISLLLDSFFASFLKAGSISWLYYADRLIYLPLGVIGVALATVVLPYLAQYHSQRAMHQYAATLDWALRTILLIGFPAALALALLAGPILATLMGHGAFHQYDVLMSAQALVAYTVGLPAFMAVKILASAFYARQDVKTPVRIAVGCVVVNILCNLALIHVLLHVGLALSTAISSIVNATALAWILKRRGIYQVSPGWGQFSARLLLANGVLAGGLWCCRGSLDVWMQCGVWMRTSWLIALMAGGFCLYWLMLYVAGFRLRDVRPPADEPLAEGEVLCAS